MYSLNKFLVKPKGNKQYNNTMKVGDVNLTISTSIEEASDVNKIAEIIAIPKLFKTEAIVGDEAVVWHNLFRISYDGKGIPKQSSYYISENLFFAEPSLVYMVIRDGKKIAINGNVFVEPVEEHHEYIGKGLRQHVGILRYSNENLEKQGFKEGDKVVFRKGCEYEFNIDNEKLYMMAQNRILAKVTN